MENWVQSHSREEPGTTDKAIKLLEFQDLILSFGQKGSLLVKTGNGMKASRKFTALMREEEEKTPRRHGNWVQSHSREEPGTTAKAIKLLEFQDLFVCL